MQPVPALDRAGRRRSPAALASFHEGRAPHKKCLRHPPDPPRVEETISAMRAAGDDAGSVRLRALIIVPWRAGLQIMRRSRWPRPTWTLPKPVPHVLINRHVALAKSASRDPARWRWRREALSRWPCWPARRQRRPVELCRFAVPALEPGRPVVPASVR